MRHALCVVNCALTKLIHEQPGDTDTNNLRNLGKFQVALFEKLENFIGGLSLSQVVGQDGVFEESGNSGQSFQMISCAIQWSYQHEKKIGRFVVHGGEINAFWASSETGRQLVQPLKFSMRDSDTIS